MARSFHGEIAPCIASGIAFAQSLAADYARSGGDINDLFSAFAGVVLERDSRVGADCLSALDRWLSASVGNDAPSA